MRPAMLMVLALLAAAVGYYGTCRVLEALRPPSAARWQAHMRAAGKARYDFATAERHYRAAIREARKFGENDIGVAESLLALAAFYRYRYGWAQEVPHTARTAVANICQACRPGGKLMETVHYELTTLHILRTCGPARVLPLYHRALAVQQRALPANDPRLGNTMAEMAGVYCEMGKHEEECRWLQRSLAVHEQYLGRDSPDLYYPLESLARCYMEVGKRQQARACLQRGLDIYEAHYGAESEELSEKLYAVVRFYSDHGDYASALPCFERAVAIEERKWGEESVRLFWPLYDLQTAYEHLGDVANAARVNARVQVIYKANPDYEWR